MSFNSDDNDDDADDDDNDGVAVGDVDGGKRNSMGYVN